VPGGGASGGDGGRRSGAVSADASGLVSGGGVETGSSGAGWTRSAMGGGGAGSAGRCELDRAEEDVREQLECELSCLLGLAIYRSEGERVGDERDTWETVASRMQFKPDAVILASPSRYF
jgi:hypothetical protein